VTHPPLPLCKRNRRNPPAGNEKRELWWATEEDKAAWIEFVEANKVRINPHNVPKDPQLSDELFQTLNFDYMTKNKPFDDPPWQYFPKPKIGHHPPLFIYGFSLGNDVSGIEHLGHATGALNPEEASTSRNFHITLMGP